jgi:hypothetical protein
VQILCVYHDLELIVCQYIFIVILKVVFAHPRLWRRLMMLRDGPGFNPFRVDKFVNIPTQRSSFEATLG